jgi:hypothetical protein
MTMYRRTRRPRKGEAFWTEYVRSGSFDPAATETETPSVAEAERLLEEARRAEAERAEALVREAEEDQRRRASFERATAADVDALEERLDIELATVRTAEFPTDREVRALSRGFLHGFTPRSLKRMSPEDAIAAHDDTAASLLELSREADLTYDRLTSNWADVPLPTDHPFALRTDAVELAAWRAFVERVRVMAGESSAGVRRPAGAFLPLTPAEG